MALYNLQTLFVILNVNVFTTILEAKWYSPFFNLKLGEVKLLAKDHIVVESRAENPDLGLGVIRVLINHTLC